MADLGLERGGIYIGLGANIPHPRHGAPQRTVRAAIGSLAESVGAVRATSRLYRSTPVVRDADARDLLAQPAFANAVVEVASSLAADALLADLHAIEAAFGRVRGRPDAPRILDLDLLDYRGLVVDGGEGRATLPHPRLHARAFVLRPLLDVAPGWRHPVSGRSARDLLADVDPNQTVEPFDPA